MTALQLHATMLTANLDARELTYLILPYGEPGRTNLGSITASAGVLDIPTDPKQVTFNEEHDYKKPVGRAKSITDTPAGLAATFSVARTSRGDDVLIEAAEGLRTGASVEIDNPVIRNGHLMGGRLTAVAAVVRPAYPSAQLVAADCGDLPTTHQEDTMGDQQPNPATAPAAAPATPVVPEPQPLNAAQALQATPTAAPNPAMAAAATPYGAAPVQPQTNRQTSFLEVAQMLAGLHGNAAGARQLFAALDQITTADAFSVTNEKQWIDEVWSGRAYQAKYIPLITPGVLTSMSILGWRFKVDKSPTVAAYAGGGAQPDSNNVQTEAVTATAARLAGAWAIDRIHRDFPSPSFWSGFFRTAADNYLRQADTKAVEAIVTGAGTALEGGTVGTDVAKAAAYIVDGAMAILEYGTPSFALVAPELYRELLLTKRNDVLEYLNMALGLEQGQVQNFTIQPYSGLAADQVLVGAKEAMTFYQLPGSPIRVDVESVSTGNLEEAVFGYYGSIVNDARALALVGDPAA